MGSGSVKGIGHSKALVVFITIFLMVLLLGSGTFQTQEAQVLVFPENPVPGSPLSVILALPEYKVEKGKQPSLPDPDPAGAEARNPEALQTETSKAESPTAMSPVTDALRPGDLIPYRASLSTTQNKGIQSAPFFYVDALQREGRRYLIVMAILVVPNTYEGNTINLDILRDTTAGAGDSATGAATSTAITAIALPKRQSLPIAPRTFASETIALGQVNTDIKTKPDPQKTAESAELWKLLTTSNPGLFTQGGFAAPVDSNRRTSFFGDRRIYQYTNGTSERTIHGGIDYGIPRGTMVRAAAPGLVLMAHFRIVTGNTVVLQHAPGVYSLYYHMDSLSVTEGSKVDGGTELGKSGSTGLSTGPHLHWEFRIQGEFADPDLMVSLAPLDKERILCKMLEKLNTLGHL